MSTQDEINAASAAAANAVEPLPATNAQAIVAALPAEIVTRADFHTSLGRAVKIADSFDVVLARMRAQIEEFTKLNNDLHAATGGQ